MFLSNVNIDATDDKSLEAWKMSEKMPPIPPAAPYTVVQIVTTSTIRVRPDGGYEMLGTETKVVPVP